MGGNINWRSENSDIRDQQGFRKQGFINLYNVFGNMTTRERYTQNKLFWNRVATQLRDYAYMFMMFKILAIFNSAGVKEE